jgi:hypothetical protein
MVCSYRFVGVRTSSGLIDAFNEFATTRNVIRTVPVIAAAIDNRPHQRLYEPMPVLSREWSVLQLPSW